MIIHVYILYSKTLDRFYTGITSESVQVRLEQHNTGHYGRSHFTSKAQDWEVFLVMNCTSLEQARKIELHIKRMKSSKYIQNLKRYPEMKEKLKSRYEST